jgi:hypothetical protein
MEPMKNARRPAVSPITPAGGTPRRRGKLLIPGAMAVIALGAVAVLGMRMFADRQTVNSVEYEHAWTALNASAEARQALGIPIEREWFSSYRKLPSGSGNCTLLEFRVHGPKDSGLVVVESVTLDDTPLALREIVLTSDERIRISRHSRAAELLPMMAPCLKDRNDNR